jgi:hypothetical protein
VLLLHLLVDVGRSVDHALRWKKNQSSINKKIGNLHYLCKFISS